MTQELTDLLPAEQRARLIINRWRTRRRLTISAFTYVVLFTFIGPVLLGEAMTTALAPYVFPFAGAIVLTYIGAKALADYKEFSVTATVGAGAAVNDKKQG